MRCLSCHKLSIQVICQKCSDKFLVPTVTKRKVGSMEVISLFKYKNIEQFILTKHTPIGYRVYKNFGKKFIAPFLDNFTKNIDEDIGILAIDEDVRSGYSHTALLSHFVQNTHTKVQHSKLTARNRVNYAGKSLQYRLDNPRDFNYTGKSNIQVVLVDDIITTGITLQEAQMELTKHDVNVLFALTLADARD